MAGLSGLIGVGRRQKEQALGGLGIAAQQEASRKVANEQIEAQTRAANMNLVGTGAGIAGASLLTKSAGTAAATAAAGGTAAAGTAAAGTAAAGTAAAGAAAGGTAAAGGASAALLAAAPWAALIIGGGYLLKKLFD